MAGSCSWASLIFCIVFFPVFAQPQPPSFIFNDFNGSESKLTLEGASIIRASGALKLTNKSNYAVGHAFYSESIQMLDNKSLPGSPKASSFSTTFVFAIVPPTSGRGGHGLAFTLSPSKQFPGAEAGHYMGIFNKENDGLSSNHVFAVEFDTVNGFNDDSDSDGNHVGININSMYSKETEPAAYFINNTNLKEDMKLESGDPVHAWIEYDGNFVNVTISPLKVEKPSQPLISHRIDLTPLVEETMYVGFSASTGEKSSSHFILGWSFSTGGTARQLNVSQLPVPPPKEKDGSSFDPQVIGLIAALSTVTVLLLGILIYFTLYKRKAKSEELEDWELDCPHRFQYKDLYAATRGFKDSEIIGVGGFGAVYKGVLPTTGAEIAVKKITQNSIQGLREFAAEIESLGRLRHKNLVNLQGWCKQKNDLLLIYEYIPYGSLHSLLFNQKQGFALSWDQRFNIIKGIAAGLLYLHEEWELVVIHRDVKSSNVLIDAGMNARLGDFGLARLYDHGTESHTTNIVGTIGYIAPELARNGKASTRSDVFAYGVLLLEVVSGRKPIDSRNIFLVDWVIECHKAGQILDAMDPKLNSSFVTEEVRLVLLLGLLCSHPKPEVRPSMRKVMRYLNRDDPLPPIDYWESFDSRDELYSKFLEVISSDYKITKSHPSSSTSTSISYSSGT
ncbi:Concanavalin A-like lectin protein kinase family protein, putative [Theobroma cacao]|uniref:non-specific serine/threonine protein kinase n=1 Tax=Theobroma cacao TaxID=3641 RepID=A0A061ER25_THECC|nr:Concanavalin A-like lectin protein kinase family protein, putative [Theobroma cacao]